MLWCVLAIATNSMKNWVYIYRFDEIDCVNATTEERMRGASAFAFTLVV